MRFATLLLCPVALAIAAPNAAPEPTAAPEAAPVADTQGFSFSIPGVGGSISSGVACGHVGPLSGCAGPSGASGNIPGLSYNGGIVTDNAALTTTTSTSTSTSTSATTSGTHTGTGTSKTTATSTLVKATGAATRESGGVGRVMLGVGAGLGGFVWGLL